MRYCTLSLVILQCTALHLWLDAQSCYNAQKSYYTFSDIKYILDKNNCHSCHFKDNSDQWHYTTYEDAWTSSRCQEPMIVAGDPSKSVLIDKLNGGPSWCGNPMPLYANSISNADLMAIESWIQSGATEYCFGFYEDIQEIFQQNQCYSCHNTTSSIKDIPLDYYSFIQSDILNGCAPLVKPYDSRHSGLMGIISQGTDLDCESILPAVHHTISNANIIKIRDWINAGAPFNANALPVNLISFSAFDNKTTVEISFLTGSEINVSHFELEYSTDGITFTSLVVIKAKGDNDTAHQYSYIHSQPQVGHNFYKLKMVDHDGLFTYSPIRLIKKFNEDEIYNIYPTLISSQTSNIYIEWYPIDQRYETTLQVYNIQGRLMYSATIKNGINILPKPQNLVSGLYYALIEDYSYNRFVKKLIFI